MKVTKLTIRGQKQLTATGSDDDLLQLDSSYLVAGATRALAENHPVDLPDDKIAEFVFEDNTTWLCSNQSITELFPEAAGPSRSLDGSFEIPLVLRNPAETERGIVSDVAVKIINIFTKKAVTIAVKKAAEKFEESKLNNRVGLYRLDENFELQNYITPDTTRPCLLFLHGTASSTDGSFGGMKGSALWAHITQTYGGNILAFQHRSLTQSPLDNIAELAALLPGNITLHIISHSRGGLLGDILSRFASKSQGETGFTKEEIDYLEKIKDGGEGKGKNDKSNRDKDIANIKELQETYKSKNIFVERFIRVACPAAGTVLASKRMDVFFNIIANIGQVFIGAAAGPAYSALKNLVAAVIDTKDDVSVLPGLEAMNPESPFIKVLNNPSTTATIDRPLAIVAGNCSIGFNLKAIRIIASKLFFLEQNDLIVNSSSMYLGTRRTEKVQYFFDDAGNVDHFHYFINDKTSQAILQALKGVPGQDIPGFTTFVQPAVTQAQRALLEGGELFGDTVTGNRPIAILLPGIMGSNIGPKGDLVWINYLKFIGGHLMDLKDTDAYSASSLIKTSYKKLKDFLSQSYDVVTFPFDWRIPLSESAKAFDAQVRELMEFNQPIKVIGHSMGGVLVRDFMVNHSETWQKLNNSAGFRLVFLGSPLGGSFRIPYVLFGKDPIIKKLSMLDIKHSKYDLLQMFSKMQGLLSLLPFEVGASGDMGNEDTWKQMRTAFGDSGWPVPDKNTLEPFRQQREKAKEVKDEYYKNAVYIAGKDKSTPMGCMVEEDTNGKELVFLSTAEGDQSVTWESGIPKAMIAADTVYYAQVTHGALANEPSLFKGIAEILESGSTSLLSKRRPVIRGEEKVFRTSEEYDFDLSAEGLENTLLGLMGGPVISKASEVPIKVKVTNGDLKYSEYPVLAGHFEDDGILFAENAIDCYLDGILKKRHRLGLYPGKIGTSEVLFSSNDTLKGAIITGLGKPGKLTAYQLSLTVEQGVASYLLHLNNPSAVKKAAGTAKTAGISSLIIGCGYGGLSVENSIRAVVEGVQNANEKIKQVYGDNGIIAEEIEFIEKLEDRALNCFYSLSRIAADNSRTLNIALGKKTITTVLGSVKRMPREDSEEWWNRITVSRLFKQNEKPDAPVKHLLFSSSTGGAREEVRDLYSSRGIMEELVDEISTQDNWSPGLAKTIFELIIPNDFKEELKKQCNINWILDKDTASYPWELLQDSSSNAKPLCINAGMIRQLATKDFRLKINAVAKSTALVISEPDLKGFAPPLPGALEEGRIAQEALQQNAFAVTHVPKGSPAEIIKALFQEDYKVIHLAGHGVFDAENPEQSGMLIGKGVYLTTREIIQMSAVPELVFVNCCFLGKTSGAAEDLYSRRYKLAANIGTQLIDNGVKAVIAAGWAVNDTAALLFTEVFYKHMLGGYNFGDAVHAARKAVYDTYPATNTWGAYQCYGDPFYKLNLRSPDKKGGTTSYVIAREAECDLFNLQNELEMGDSAQQNLEKLKEIAAAVDKAQVRDAGITEKEALIYTELAMYDQAIAKFEALLNMEKANFSFLSMEKYCNVRAKKYVQDFLKSGGKDKQYYRKIDAVIAHLDLLINSGATAERYSLLGSAYKRKAMLTVNDAEKDAAYQLAANAYNEANKVKNNSNIVYTATNWLELLSIIAWRAGKELKDTLDADTFKQAEAMKAKLEKKQSDLDDTPDEYWDMVAAANIKLTLLLLNRKEAKNAAAWNQVGADFMKIWKRAGSPGKKLAELEQLQFLADALSTAPAAGEAGSKRRKTAQPDDVITSERLGIYIEEVRKALENMSAKKTTAAPAAAAPKKAAAKKRAAKK
ncbi:CHAT domain-containing protein [Foetidibacter luteolus]|uniref:CHAT domain-containing protein n=1 Tax=Foetidibacter luteolus TaxID=2608880 RepID=UPI00129A6191|nr:CHAT domain-containing protein [Foetidibacter luteolus]